MKSQLRNLFSFILKPLESGAQTAQPQPHSRKILIFISAVFGMLALLLVIFRPENAGIGGWLPVLIFSCVSVVGLVVGCLGNDRALAKIWGSR